LFQEISMCRGSSASTRQFGSSWARTPSSGNQLGAAILIADREAAIEHEPFLVTPGAQRLEVPEDVIETDAAFEARANAGEEARLDVDVLAREVRDAELRHDAIEHAISRTARAELVAADAELAAEDPLRVRANRLTNAKTPLQIEELEVAAPVFDTGLGLKDDARAQGSLETPVSFGHVVVVATGEGGVLDLAVADIPLVARLLQRVRPRLGVESYGKRCNPRALAAEGAQR
jgi:hypothetical protein